MAEGVETGKLGLEEQKHFLSNQLQKPLVIGEIWYMLDTKWLKQWKTFVGYESWDTYNQGEESANPGPVDNTPLFEEGTLKLKEHLIDDLDYNLVPAEGWNKLLSWYGIVDEEHTLSRKVIEEGVYSKSLKVEVYPWHLKISENSKPDEQVNKQFSRSDTIQQLEKTMRKVFNISEDKEVRLWNRYLSNMYQPLTNKQNTLQDAGLYQGQVVVIEQKNDDGTWPRPTPQNSKSSVPSSSMSVSTRSSYNNYNEYGRSSCGSSPGLCGLSNIGNTCFMNSALQCMSNVPRLTEYFLSDNWSHEVNEDNPLGMHGEIARTYAELVQTMWSGRYSYTVPRNFKVAVGRFAPQFSGYQQQDSQELMAFLLDGLHEDLNRIKKKPYIEQKDADNRPDEVVSRETWDNYKKRNDSIITDLFHGLLKSTVQCPECQKISVTFDPFCYLSLPLPVKKERFLEIFWVPLDPQKKTQQFKLTVPKMGGVADMCEILSQFVGVKKDKMVVTDVYNHRFHRIFTAVESLSNIMDRDDIFVYEIPDSEEMIVVPVYLREEKLKSGYNSAYSSHQLFGHPVLLPVPKKGCTYDQLYNIVLKRLERLVTVPNDEDTWWREEKDGNNQCDQMSDTEENNSATTPSHTDSKDSSEDSGMEISNGDSTTEDNTPDSESSSGDVKPAPGTRQGQLINGGEQSRRRLFKFSVVNSYGSAEMEYKLKDDGRALKLSSRTYISLDWTSKVREKCYNENEAEVCEQHESMKAKPAKKQIIQLGDCLDMFTTKETLGENDPWYCPKCKKHQQATKKFDLWSLPDTLIIMLKRFSYSRYWRDKLDAMVEFPTRGLDMQPYVIDTNHKENYTYDLIGVANHYGGLGGGHYTATCYNINENQWYYFDDSSVSSKNEDDAVSKAAYVLVYQKRGTLRVKKSAPSSTASHCEEVNGDDGLIHNGEDTPMDTN